MLFCLLCVPGHHIVHNHVYRYLINTKIDKFLKEYIDFQRRLYALVLEFGKHFITLYVCIYFVLHFLVLILLTVNTSNLLPFYYKLHQSAFIIKVFCIIISHSCLLV